jgi:ferredoxin-NADP reductase
MAIAQKLCCKVERIVNHGEHVYTIDLLSRKHFPLFKPGQFLHLALDPYDPAGFWPDSRVFSIASPPQQHERLSITYSVRGHFTNRMEKELAENKKVWIKMPYGEFIIHATSDVALFAGGTGITAFTSFLDGLMPAFPHRVYLVYGARKSDLLIYRDLVQRCVTKHSGFKAFYFVEQDLLGDSVLRSEIVGQLSVTAIQSMIKNPLETTYYISGPPPMLKGISRDLIECGIRADAIRIDAWE